jgi:hypothetical protein
MVMAIVLESCVVLVLWQHRNELIELLWRRQPAEPRFSFSRDYAKYSIRFAVIIIPFLFTYYVANFNSRDPTPIDGPWEIVAVTGGPVDLELPTHIYFERNRAWMCVFRYADSWDVNHFEVNEDRNDLKIWENYRSKGKTVFSGTYDLEANNLRLTGSFADTPLDMRLQRSN